jgi:hypothetical protein
VTLAVDAVVVAGGIFLGRLVARVLRQRRQRQAGETGASSDAKSASPNEGRRSGLGQLSPSAKRQQALDGFACRLGDVVVRRLEGDEAWLAGALVFAEERPVAALFIAPVAGGERAVLVPGPGQTTLAWLTPLAQGEVTVVGDAPQALEHTGTHFERTRRLPVHVQRIGSGAPDVGATAVLGEYAGPGLERIVVVVGPVAVRAWRGVALSKAEYDVLPGGSSTLET